MGKFKSRLSYTGRQANNNNQGSARFATQAEANAGTADDLIVAPNTLDAAVDALIEDASQTTKGIVELATAAEMSTGTDAARVPAVKVVYDYVNTVAIAGAPTASESQEGIAEIATTAEAQAGTDDARIMTAAKVVDLLETPPAIGGTTPAAGSFTTLAATGACDFDAGGTWESGGATLSIAADAGTDAVNLGTGAAARTISIGNATGATQLDIDSGSGGTIMDSTGAISLDAAAASNFSTSGAGVDLTLESAAGRVIVNGGEDAADCIYLHADAGTSEKIRLHSDQGTAADSVELESDVGGITLLSGLASADAINLTASSGGIDCDAAGQVNIASSQNAADAIRINASAGGIDIDAAGAAGEDISIVNSAGSIFIQGKEDHADCVIIEADGGTSEKISLHADQGTGVDSISLASDVGGVTVLSGLASDDAINLNATAGGVDIDGAMQVNITSSENTVDAIRINASAGGIDIDAAGAATEDISIVNAAGSIFIQGGEDDAACVLIEADGGTSERVHLHADQGTGVDSIFLESDVGGLTLSSGLASADAINLSASAGGVDVDGALQVNIASSQNAADAIRINASAGGIDIDAAGAAAEDISIVNAAGSIFIQGGEDDAACVLIEADGGTSERVHLHADQGTGVDSIFLESDVGGLTLSSGLASADAINLSASAGGVDVDGALEVNIASSRAATGALTLAVSNAAANITNTGAVAYTPDSITSDNAGTAASINTVVTLITTDGDSNEDNVTLADGVIAGQIKIFSVIVAGNAADSVKITPANMAGGSKITFGADPTGLGCMMVFDGTNWSVASNNGGTIA